MATTIETDLKEVLGEIKQQLNEIQKDVTDIKINQARMDGEISTIKTELSLTREDVKDIKGRATAQIWTLIGLISTIIAAIVTTLVKLSFFSNP